MKKIIKKLVVLGLACSMVVASSVTAMAKEYPVNFKAGDAKCTGKIYANITGTAGGYMSSTREGDLYIEDGYAENADGEARSFAGSSEQSTYVSAYVSIFRPSYASANFICCPNDGGYNKVFYNVYRSSNEV